MLRVVELVVWPEASLEVRTAISQLWVEVTGSTGLGNNFEQLMWL